MKALHIFCCLILVGAPDATLAQSRDSASATAQASTRRSPPFFTYRDALLLGVFVGGTIAMAPLDKEFAHNLQDPSFQESNVVKHGAAFFRFMGQPAPQIIGLGLYAGGRIFKVPRLTRLGLHGFEAMILSNAVTTTIKMTAGRARPYVHFDTVSNDFQLFRGFKGTAYQSFPSGHATTAFAAASATTAEVSHWIDESGWAPAWKVAVGTVMYGGAALVGVSRVYHDKHWGSDVVAGAAIGTFSGIKVVRYNHRHPKNKVERTLAAITPYADPSGRTGFSLAFTTR